MTATDQPAAEQLQTVREFHRRVLTEKDLEAVPEVLTSDYVEHNPALPDGVLRGRDRVVDFWEDLFEAFPDLEIIEQDALVDGDMVVTRHVGRGTHQGPFMEIPGTGRAFEVGGISGYRLENGKIAESWISLDLLGLLDQITPEEEGSQ